MKVGSLIGGIILLVIAVMGFTTTSNSVSEKQTTLGEIERFISDDASTSYQVNQMAQLVFGGLGAIGLGLTIYGAVASGSPKEKSNYYCEYCGFPAPNYTEVKQHMLHCSHNPSLAKRASPREDDVKNLGILKERLAKGEITKKEYDKLKQEFDT